MRSLTALAGAGVYLIMFCGRDFWDPDEPRFAQIAREMLQGGDWLIPHFDGRPIALLPPLSYWTSSIASWPFGDVTPWAARLPVVLFAILALGATMLLAGRAGIASGLVLLSSAKFLHQAQYLQADMLLVGAQTWALVAFYRGYAVPERRGAWLASAYVAVALGVLAKGPLGALLPAAVMGSFLIWERDLRALSRMGLVWGVPLVLLLVTPWFGAACMRGGEGFCRELLLRHNFGMFFDTWSHARPFYYYLLELPWMLLPWTFLLPAAMRGVEIDRRHRFLLAWIGFTFLFFSASDAKQAKYLLPILPPLSILIGQAIDAGRGVRALRLGAVTLGIAFAAAGVAVVVGLPERYCGITTPALAVAASGIPFAGGATWMAGRKAGRWLFAGVLLGPALSASLLLAPALESFKSPRALTELAASLGHPVAVHGISYRQSGGLIFYTGRLLPVLDSSEELRSFMGEEEPRLAYVSRKGWRGEYPVVAESPYRGGTLLVINREEFKP